MGVCNNICIEPFHQTLHRMSQLWTFTSKYCKTNAPAFMKSFHIYSDVTSLENTLEIVGDWCILVIVSIEDL